MNVIGRCSSGNEMFIDSFGRGSLVVNRGIPFMFKSFILRHFNTREEQCPEVYH